MRALVFADRKHLRILGPCSLVFLQRSGESRLNPLFWQRSLVMNSFTANYTECKGIEYTEWRITYVERMSHSFLSLLRRIITTSRCEPMFTNLPLMTTLEPPEIGPFLVESPSTSTSCVNREHHENRPQGMTQKWKENIRNDSWKLSRWCVKSQWTSSYEIY